MQPAIGASGFARVSAGTVAGVVRFPCQSPVSPMPCYGPDQVRAAYDVQSVIDSGIDGTGQTIVIIDAFQNPRVRTDLALFDQMWGLPSPTLTISAPDGLTPFDPTNREQFGWAVEISVDVEWAHAIAPGAAIQLVLAKTSADSDLLSATRFAVDGDLGGVISQSFSEAESCADAAFFAAEHDVFESAKAKGITLVASAGDFGPGQRDCNGSFSRSAGTPASDPNVTAVGGTRLVADPVSGAYQGETVWGDQFGASGGGFSSVYRRPGYQAPFVDGHGARAVPDVSWSADAFGAPLVIFSGHPGIGTGTSAGAPQWAGVAALANQMSGHHQVQLNVRLYHVAKSKAYTQAFHDITTGTNSFGPFAGTAAGPGWDAASGLGSPDVAVLLPLLSRG